MGFKKKKKTPHTVVMKGEISFRDQICCLYQAVNMLISAVKLDILTGGSMEIDSPASCGHSRNCSFWLHFTAPKVRPWGLHEEAPETA